MKIGITRFPGTNCDFDIWNFSKERGHEPQWLWHSDRFETNAVDAVIVPGGFSYGDYLRCGALAARSPVMNSVRDFAKVGKSVLGICNGFQILCESGLLPGILVRNARQKFIDDWVTLELVEKSERFLPTSRTGDKFNLPIAHGEGCFRSTGDQLKKIQDHGQIWLRYSKNPNGSTNDIAGVLNAEKNVAALMPHPERALFGWMGGTDGAKFL